MLFSIKGKKLKIKLDRIPYSVIILIYTHRKINMTTEHLFTDRLVCRSEILIKEIIKVYKDDPVKMKKMLKTLNLDPKTCKGCDLPKWIE